MASGREVLRVYLMAMVLVTGSWLKVVVQLQPADGFRVWNVRRILLKQNVRRICSNLYTLL
jgi:hypothetical protein